MLEGTESHRNVIPEASIRRTLSISSSTKLLRFNGHVGRGRRIYTTEGTWITRTRLFRDKGFENFEKKRRTGGVLDGPDLPIFTRAVSPCPLQLPPAKPPLPGLLPLLHPCNKVDAVRVGHKLKKEMTSHSRVLDLGDEFLDLFAYMLGFLRVLHFECSYVRHHLFKVSSRNGVQLL